jgi:hypothetical protein
MIFITERNWNCESVFIHFLLVNSVSAPNIPALYAIWDSDYEGYCILGWDAMQCGKSLLMFHTNILPSSSSVKREYMSVQLQLMI